MLFDSICNSQWFTKTSMVSQLKPRTGLQHSGLTLKHTKPHPHFQILFLNKDDIFRQKILNPRSQISDHFSDYSGPTGSYDAGRAYFQKKFTGLNRSTSKDVYTHFTTATDTVMLTVVMVAVQE